MRKKAFDLKKIMLAGALALVGFFSIFINATIIAYSADPITQDSPFIYQNTAGDNVSLFYETEDTAQLMEKRGNSIVYNQLNDPDNFTPLVTLDEKHIYLYKSESNGNIFEMFENIAFGTLYNENDILLDLTLWYGSNDNIPSDIIEFPEEFNRYYRGNFDYNPGTILDSNGQYLISTGRNIYDSSNEYNQVMPGVPYYYYANNITTISYYDLLYNLISSEVVEPRAIFITPANCAYINSSYDSNITITFYISDQSGYNSTYPFETLSQIDTGDEILRGFGDIYDVKLPSGIIIRKIGAIDMGTLNYDALGNGIFQIASGLTGKAIGLDNIFSNMYIFENVSNPQNLSDMSMRGGSASNYVYFKNSNYSTAAEFKTAMSGVYLYYELNSATEEEGTAFEDEIIIDKLGSITWSATDYNGVPQGIQIIYDIADPITPEIPEEESVSPWSVLIFVLLIIFIISLFTANRRS